MNSQKVFESFEAAGITGLNYNRTRQKVRCPKCDQDRSDKRDKSLSVNISGKFFKCHYPPCSFSGIIRGFEDRPKEYTLPNPDKLSKALSPEALKYLKGRGFNEITIKAFGITSYFGKKAGEDVLQFPYKREGVLINVKSRTLSKNAMHVVANAELTLFNIDRIDPDYPLIITEGEFDCMAFYQAGKYNVVSVPNGANLGADQKLEYIDNSWDYLIDVETFILATDGDKAGLALRDALAKRLGKDKCKVVSYPEGCKDANDVLLAEGEIGVRKLIENAKELPIEGIVMAGSYLDRVLFYRDHGFPKGADLGFKDFDEIFSWHLSQATIITGSSNNGKSQGLDHIMLRLAVRHNWKFAVLSAENDPYDIYITELVQAFAAKPIDRLTPDEISIITNRFLSKHIILLGLEDTTIPNILERARILKLRYGIQGLVIDPWNTLTHETNGKSELEYIRETLKQLIRFCKSHDIHLILVAHPKKIYEVVNGKQRIPTGNDIAGSGDFERMVDNIIVVYREQDTRDERKSLYPAADRFYELGDTVVWRIDKVRKKYVGRKGKVHFDIQWRVPNYAPIDTLQFENLFDVWKEKHLGIPMTLQPGHPLATKIEPISTPKPLRFPEERADEYINGFSLSTEGRTAEF